MSIRTLSTLALGLTLALGACNTSGKDGDANNLNDDYEGDDPGECSDQADNDRDGYFDCQDNGCWGHPDCDGYTGPGGTGPGTGPGGTGTGTGTGTGSAACPGHALCDLTSFTADVRIDIDSDLGALGICDCYLEYRAEGDFQLYDPTTDRVEFYGSWIRTDAGVAATGTGTGSGTGTGAATGGTVFEPCDPLEPPEPCGDEFAAGIWWTTNPVYHSVMYGAGDPPVVIEDWIAYEFPGSYEPQPNPGNAHQFYITDLFSDYDHSQASPTSSAVVVEQSSTAQFEFTTSWNATFQK